jgi:hypothetical protein
MAASIFVMSKTQSVELRDGAKILWTAPVSTSIFGLGEESESNKTPRGAHHIEELIGGEAPLNGIFESRIFTGSIWDGAATEKDLILTRILWLSGDDEFNRNTHARYIYFHGTNHEDVIGQPASHGCIRLKNLDMLHLFNSAAVGMKVTIE